MDKITTRISDFYNRLTRTQLIAAGLLGAASLTTLILGKRYFNGASCDIVKDLTDQVIIITGSNTGIGKETARVLAGMGATVILACRDTLKGGESAADELRRATMNSKIEFMHLDLADLASVKAFTEAFKAKFSKLNILINNAGIMALNHRAETKDGFEAQFGVNFLGHFYLTTMLLDLLRASGQGRVINLSSGRHEKGRMHWDDLMSEHNYSPYGAYDQSKLALVMFTKELQKRLDKEGANVKAVALNPGIVRSELDRHVSQGVSGKLKTVVVAPVYYYITKNAHQGAQTSLYCALVDYEMLKGGYYYNDCRLAAANPEAVLEENGAKLWEYSERIVAQKLKDPIWL